MGAVTFSLYHIFAGLSSRDETQTVFNRDLMADRRQVMLYGLALVLTILATEIPLLQRLLETSSLNGQQWLTCVLVALSVLVVDEIIKFFLRRRRSPQSTVSEVTPATGTDRVDTPAAA
jgi:Ca2+-transporting ATPase